MLVFLAFALKLVIVAAVARLVRARCGDWLRAGLAAWVIVTGLCFAAMLALSAFTLLTQPAFWMALGAGAALAALALRRGLAVPALPREGRLLLGLFGLFWLAFAARALVFQDFTADAQGIQLARIGIWMNYQTVLVHMPALFTSVFSADWNGELLGLFYGLATGDLQGPIFGNVEVLLVTYLACVWLARLMGASWPWAYAIGGLVALCPACLGIATTVKGDLLAAGAAVLALGWVLVLRGDRSGFAAAMLVACVALAAGAKLASSVVAAALGLLGLVLAGPRPFFARAHATRTLPLGLALAAVFLSRYAINALVYGNPVQRMAGEGAEPGLGTFLYNIELIARRSFEFSVHAPGGTQHAWHLAGGLGVTGFAAVAAMAGLAFARRRRDLPVLGALAAALLISCFAVPPYWWGLRYFLPAILPLCIVVFALAAARPHRLVIAAACVLAAVNVSYLTWPGELNGNKGFVHALREQLGKGPIERTLISDEDRPKNSKFHELRLDRPEPLTFVIFQNDRDPGRDILPFVGSRAQHRLVLVGSQADVAAAARAHGPEFIVVAKPASRDLPAQVHDAVAAAGFIWIDDNTWVAIAARADQPEARLGPLKSILADGKTGAGAPTWLSGAHERERYQGFAFRWLERSAEMEVPLSGGSACLEVTFFGAEWPERRQLVRVEGAAAEPSSLDLTGTHIHFHRKFHIVVRGSGSAARLRFVADMPEISFPNDPRRIVFGTLMPPIVTRSEACRTR